MVHFVLVLVIGVICYRRERERDQLMFIFMSLAMILAWS